MPGYIFAPFYSPYYMPPTRPPDGPGLMLRARVWLRQLELDAALAGGANPAQSEELELRAKQIADRKTRNKLATAITRLIRIADGHRAPIMCRIRRFGLSRSRPTARCWLNSQNDYEVLSQLPSKAWP